MTFDKMKLIKKYIYKTLLLIKQLSLFHTHNVKHILLYCEVNPSTVHVLDYYETIKNIENAQFYVYFTIKEYRQCYNFNGVKVINKLELYLHYFDLVITGFGFPQYLRCKETKQIYTNHGFHIIGLDGGKNTVTYEAMKKMKPDIICESNAYIVRTMINDCPDLADHIKWVGWKFSEEELSQLENRNEIRKNYGFKNDQKVLLIAATWGPMNLFHTYGDEIFAVIKSLSKDYKIVLAPHFHEFETTAMPHYGDNNYKNCGNEILSLKDCGCIVRNPNEPWIPYMVAADVVFTDYSTLSEAAVEMGKKVVFSNFPDEAVWKYSVAGRARQYYHVAEKASDLPEMITKVLDDDVPEEAEQFMKEVYISRMAYDQKIINITNDMLIKNNAVINYKQKGTS